jgi:hypothetical protein
MCCEVWWILEARPAIVLGMTIIRVFDEKPELISMEE